MRITPLCRAALTAFVASASLSFGSGCIGDCDPVGSQYHAPITVAPSSVSAVRTPASCDAGDAPFTDEDSFSLQVIGKTDVPPPYNTLTLVVTPSIPLNVAFPLNVDEATQTATLTSPAVHFTYAPGSLQGEIDSTALDAVVVTVLAMPTADGEPLAATLQLFFADGSELDQPFSAPVTGTACAVPTSSPSAT